MYLSQKIGANLVRFVTSVHVANIFKVSNICKSPQKTCMHLQERTKTRRRSTSKIWGFSEKSYKVVAISLLLSIYELITIQFGNFSNHKDSITIQYNQFSGCFRGNYSEQYSSECYKTLNFHSTAFLKRSDVMAEE